MGLIDVWTWWIAACNTCDGPDLVEVSVEAFKFVRSEWLSVLDGIGLWIIVWCFLPHFVYRRVELYSDTRCFPNNYNIGRASWQENNVAMWSASYIRDIHTKKCLTKEKCRTKDTRRNLLGHIVSLLNLMIQFDSVRWYLPFCWNVLRKLVMRENVWQKLTKMFPGGRFFRWSEMLFPWRILNPTTELLGRLENHPTCYWAL